VYPKQHPELMSYPVIAQNWVSHCRKEEMTPKFWGRSMSNPLWA
jgi:hypothetical protein